MPQKNLRRNPTTKSELLLFDIWEKLSIAGAGGAGATEATLLSVLNAIVASDQDIEILLVRDTVTLIVYQQITDYTTGVPVVSYKDVNGTPFVPVNPMEYLDPSAVLNLVLASIQAQGLVPQATEVTQLLVEQWTGAMKITNDNISTRLTNATATDGTATNNIGFLALGSDGVNDQTLKTNTAGELEIRHNIVEGRDGVGGGGDGLRVLGNDGVADRLLTTDAAGHLQIDVLSNALPTGAATEVTLASLLVELALKADLTETQPVSLPSGVHAITQQTFVAGGSVAAGAVKVSIMNIGTTNATVLGNPLEPGLSIPFEATNGKTLPEILYVASATAILKIVTTV